MNTNPVTDFENERTILIASNGKNKALTDAQITYLENAEKIDFLPIDINKIKIEFGFNPTKNIISLLPSIISGFKDSNLV